METRVLANPANILELLADYQPELILLDLYMPLCSGIELAAVIRQQEAYVGMPIEFFRWRRTLPNISMPCAPGGTIF